MRDIIGHGGGKGGGSSHTHYEAPDSLHSTSYARVLDLTSEGEILGLAEGLQSIYLNDTPIQNEDGSYNFQGVTVDFRTGTQDQDYIPGFPDVESETPVGVELKYGTPWVRAFSNLQLSAVRITLGVDQLYKADTNNGDVGGSIVNYAIELSTDGGAYQTVLSNAFNGKTMSAYRRTARIDLPRATTGWQIRVTRLTPNSTVVSIVDKTNIVSFTEVIDAKLRYPMSAIVGIQVDAKQFQSVPTRAYDLFGRIIQVPSNYDPRTRAYSGTWDGTFKPSWSDNPAWVFRDLVLNDRYGLGHRITAAQLDKWTLYKIARYCDELVPNGSAGTEPRFTCNLYLQTRKQAYAVLQDIASIFRGISYWGAGTIMASADMPSDPVYVYTAANVINGKFTRTGTKKSTRYTVALVTWNDPADGYKPKVEYVEDVEGIARYGIQQTELTAFGCTSQGQAHRAGRWALATSRLETEGISFDVGLDGAIALPGQVVRIADPSRMGRRVGGRVRAVAGRTITLDKAPTVKAGDRLTVMLPAGTSETRAVSSVAGDAVTVDSDWSTMPRTAAVWSVDSDELSAPLFRVLSVTEKDEVTFTITAVQHEPGKYDFVEKGTAITPRTQTSLDVTRQAPPASVTLAGYTVSLADVQKLALQVSCAPVAGAVAYEGAYRRGNDNWVAIPRQPSPTMDVLDILPGTYMAKMAAVNSIGVTSVEVQSVAVEIARDGASKNATIILQSDAQQFHIDEGGQVDPLSITFSAILIALDGPVEWSCLGGTLTNTTATTAQLTFANASGPAAVVTAKVTAFGRTYSQSLTIRKVQDGAAGSDGLQTDVARLYQWAPIAPSKPTGTSTFSWVGLTNSGYTGNDGWASPAPNNPGTPGWRLYVASVGVSAPIAATSSPVGYSNAAIEAWSQNGTNGTKGDTGASGIQSRPATVYQWAVSIPAGPTGPATFKWSDGTYGDAPTNWTLTPDAAPSLGMTLFAATYQVVDSAIAATTAFNWQSAIVMAIGYVGTNGQKGDTGSTGSQGASYVTAYCATTIGTGTSAPAPTKGRNSLPAANSGGLVGVFTASVPTLTAGQYQMQVDGSYDATTDYITWSIPYQSALKVATLSAITANLGAINAGSINLGNGTFTVDNDGNLVCRSIKIMNPDGSVMLQAGGQLNPANAAPGTLNSAVSMSSTGQLIGAGGGQVQTLPVTDGARTVNYAPRDYGVVHVKEFKQCAYIGIPDYSNTYCVLETMKPWIDNSGGFATQWAYISASEVWKRSGGCGDDHWGAWVRDMDRNLFTGDLNATNGATWGANINGQPSDISNLVKKGIFEDGSMGSWNGLAVEGPFRPGCPYSKAITTRQRDATEVGNGIPVTPGETLYLSGWLDTGDTVYLGRFGVFGLDINNNIIAFIVGFNQPALTGWTYYEKPVTIPQGVVTVVPWLGQEGFDFTVASWLHAAGLFIGRHARGATVGAPSGTMVGGTEAGLVASRAAYGQQAYDALPGITSQITDKLSQTAGNVLRAPIALATGGGVVVGSLTYDATTGLRSGGTGMAITPYGMIAHNGIKYTLAFEASTGNTYFSGELSGASGTFGALRVSPGGMIGMQAESFGQAGIWAGDAGGVYKFSIVAANGAKLLFDPSDPNPLQIKNADIANSTTDVFTGYLGGSAGGSFPNPNPAGSVVGFGSLTANAVGGTGAISYMWLITPAGRVPSNAYMKLDSSSGKSVGISGTGANTTLSYTVTCIMTDQSNRTVILSAEITSSLGTPT